jgi:hypothetical protein
MEAASFYFFLKQEGPDKMHQSSALKINIFVKKRFEKYCGSILVLSILDAETSSV